jgi:hypothetical protein
LICIQVDIGNISTWYSGEWYGIVLQSY